MTTSNIESMTIGDLFDRAWSIQDELDKRHDCCESDYIRKLNDGIKFLEKCDLMIDQLHLFSDNESLDEVSTNELRFKKKK